MLTEGTQNQTVMIVIFTLAFSDDKEEALNNAYDETT